MNSKWSKEEVDYLNLIYKRYTADIVADKINEKFNTNRTEKSIYSKANKINTKKIFKEHILSISDICFVYEINRHTASRIMRICGGVKLGQRLIINSKNCYKIDNVVDIITGKSNEYFKFADASSMLGYNKIYLHINYKKHKIDPIKFMGISFISLREINLLKEIMSENNSGIDWEYFKKHRIKERVVYYK